MSRYTKKKERKRQRLAKGEKKRRADKFKRLKMWENGRDETRAQETKKKRRKYELLLTPTRAGGGGSKTRGNPLSSRKPLTSGFTITFRGDGGGDT